MLGLVVASVLAVVHRQEVIDWWRLSQYKPSAEVLALAESDTMQNRGRDLFYISDPKVEDSGSFNQHCSNHGEQSIVLGCYTAQRIFLYNVTDARLSGVKEVTAAHEMLHAAYERLSHGDKQHVNAMLEPIIKNMQDPRILDLIKLYNQQEPGELYNEMHSILGTEYAGLSPELEDYYKQYFAGRQKIVNYSQQYEALLSQSKANIALFDVRLGNLKTQIDQNNATLQQKQQDLQTESSRLNQLRAQDPQAYNQAVPSYNAQVREFNSLVEQTKSLVAEYNALVEQRNQQAAAQDNLYQSLDSHYQAVPQN